MFRVLGKRLIATSSVNKAVRSVKVQKAVVKQSKNTKRTTPHTTNTSLHSYNRVVSSSSFNTTSRSFHQKAKIQTVQVRKQKVGASRKLKPVKIQQAKLNELISTRNRVRRELNALKKKKMNSSARSGLTSEAPVEQVSQKVLDATLANEAMKMAETLHQTTEQLLLMDQNHITVYDQSLVSII